METLTDFIFLASKITADGDHSFLLGRKAISNLDSILKSGDITLPTKVCLVKAMIFSSSHVWMWELDNKIGWPPKNWCLWTVVLEKTLDSPLDCKENKPVNSKGNQPWIVTRRTDAWNQNSNTLATWCEEPTHWKRPWCWERQEKGMAEDEMVGCHHWLDGLEFEQAPGVGNG